MLSVLIPIHNYAVFDFIKSLDEQCQKANIPYEIIAVDDASKPEYRRSNQALTAIPNLIYEELSHNLGRNKIRPYLAQKAKYEYLLFLDCDQAVDGNFIERYLNTLKTHKNGIIYGGRSYYDTCSKTTVLRWKYGKHREELSAEERTKNPYKTFLTNNFLIPKSIFQTLRFDDQIQGYGYEDTLLSLQLFQKNIPIWHLNNPAIHKGLEENEAFLENTKMAMTNLKYITSHYSIPKKHIRIYDFYTRLKKLKLDTLVNYIIACFMPIVRQNLKSGYPSLYCFDAYKLYYFLRV